LNSNNLRERAMAERGGGTAGKRAGRDKEPVILAIDIGGTHVKLCTSADREKRAAESGPTMTAGDMVDAVRHLADGLAFDRVSMGYPGPVVHGRPLTEPANLGGGWVGYDFAKAFGVPTRIVNDALMQAIGSYSGGRMLFLGLGTGLGAAMVADNVALPMELAHLPYRKHTYEDYVSNASLERRGKKKWRALVFDVVERLRAALEPDDIVIGGGNVAHLETLPAGCRRGDNELAFEGGFRLWRNAELKV
jgi:polyphosphate glucokinase